MKSLLIKQIVDYWNARPCNVKNSSAELGSEKYWNDITERRYFLEPQRKVFADFPQWKDKDVLEVGCGIGTDAEQFARHGARYVGIDISSESIKLCEQRFQTFGLHGVFKTMDGADTENFLGLGKFDFVFCYGVLHHYPNPRQIIENIYQVLRPNAKFRFLVYAKHSWKYAMIREGLDQYEAQDNCPHADVYTEESIRELVKDKFEINSIRQTHCFMYNIEEYKKGNFVLEPWFECMPENMRAAIDEHLGWHLLVDAKKI